MKRPLEKINVVAIEQVVAATLAAARLADAGAEVINVEQGEGGFVRRDDRAARGQSRYVAWLNCRERQALNRWIDDKVTLVQNLKFGALARLGFSFKRLEKAFPKRISVSILGVVAKWRMAPPLKYKSGTPLQPLGMAHRTFAPYSVFTAKDSTDHAN